jgi:hypothetical protein
MVRNLALRQRVRQELRSLARQVNNIVWVTVASHEMQHEIYPERSAALDLDDPTWPEKLTSSEKRAIRIAISIRKAIRAEEEGNEEVREDALKLVQEYVVEKPLWMSLEYRDATAAVVYSEYDPNIPGVPEMDENRPFHVSVMVLSFVKYLEWYKEFLGQHLGVCRQCDKVYLKPIHGADSMYCSGACAQKAYRERKKAAGKE